MSSNLTMQKTSSIRFALSHRFIFFINSTNKLTSHTNIRTSSICNREKLLNNIWLIDTHSLRWWLQMLFFLIFRIFVDFHVHNYQKLAICWHSNVELKTIVQNYAWKIHSQNQLRLFWLAWHAVVEQLQIFLFLYFA